MKKPLTLFAVGISIGFGFAGLANSDTKTGSNQPRLVRDFFLCKSGHSGQIETYSCREYEQKSRTVRVFFKGGDIPRAISSFSGKNASTLVPVSKETAAIAGRFSVSPPSGIPTSATFMGSGVCLNDKDHAVPCGVFVHKPARTRSIDRYMVFYEPTGLGAADINRQNAGPNLDAIPAELAFQIGLGLVETGCCQVDGLRYLKMALDLFPDFQVYRQTYKSHENRLASLQTSPDDYASPGTTINEAKNELAPTSIR